MWEGVHQETASCIIDTDSITGHKTVPWPTGKFSGIRLHECLSATRMLISKQSGDEMQKLRSVAGRLPTKSLVFRTMAVHQDV